MKDKQLFRYLSNRSKWNMKGVEIIKIDYHDYPKMEYIDLTMRMGMTRAISQELYKAGFHMAYSYLNSDYHLIYEFMRWKEGHSYNE